MAKKTSNAKGQIKELLAKIEGHKEVIAKERDALRSLYSELEDLVETLDRGVESVESGLREISDGIDAFSERL